MSSQAKEDLTSSTKTKTATAGDEQEEDTGNNSEIINTLDLTLPTDNKNGSPAALSQTAASLLAVKQPKLNGAAATESPSNAAAAAAATTAAVVAAAKAEEMTAPKSPQQQTVNQSNDNNDDNNNSQSPKTTPDSAKAVTAVEEAFSTPERVHVQESSSSSPSPPSSSSPSPPSSPPKDQTGTVITTGPENVHTPPSASDDDDERQQEEEEEDYESSSNDDSSYFRDPKNLPSPKSERRYSHNSLPDILADDLLISDDSDDGGGAGGNPSSSHHQHHNSDPGFLEHLKERKVTELFPKPITRMHSYSSLVSDELDDDDDNDDDSDDDASSSDPSVRDELRKVADKAGRRRQQQQQQQHEGAVVTPQKIPSGRISPILGEHAPSRNNNNNNTTTMPAFHSPSSINPSPPTIMAAFQQQLRNFPHPQPSHSGLTPEQLAMWMTTTTTTGATGAAAAAAAASIPPPPPPLPPVTEEDVKQRKPISNRSMESSKSLVYSDDTSHSAERAMRTSANLLDMSLEQQQQSQQLQHRRAGTNNEPATRDPLLLDKTRSGSEEEHQHQHRRHRHDDDHDHPEVSFSAGTTTTTTRERGKGFKVYWQRWIMLVYMSVLNLLSDWTCYSVAPIALLTEEAFGRINPEQLVVVFLGANAIATACEPILLSRLGLRRTVLFGALLLMLGSIVKSGGMPPIIQANLTKGQGEWRVYLGFFLVGLSQPLYQCTPALLSASWFPEVERTMATGVALNANQLGIGFAFIFGTLLVAESDDIPGYFGLLSLLSTITFLGVLIQFDDAPPTPPSDTARVMRGTIDMKLPSVQTIFDSVRNLGRDEVSKNNSGTVEAPKEEQPQMQSNIERQPRRGSGSSQKRSSRASSSPRSSSSPRASSSPRSKRRSSDKQSSRRSGGGGSGGVRHRKTFSHERSRSTGSEDSGFHGLAPAPSPAFYGSVGKTRRTYNEGFHSIHPAPSPVIPGPVAESKDEESVSPTNQESTPSAQQEPNPYTAYGQPNPYIYPGYPYGMYPPPPFQNPEGAPPVGESDFPPGYSSGLMPGEATGISGAPPGYWMPYGYPPSTSSTDSAPDYLVVPPGYPAPTSDEGMPGYPMILPGYPSHPGDSSSDAGMQYNPYQYPGYPNPYWDPRFQMYNPYYQHLAYQLPPVVAEQSYYSYQQHPPSHFYTRVYDHAENILPPSDKIDEGAEPVLTLTPHHLDINIRDDQVLLSTRACLSRPGFIHALVSFTVSGIVINTLSTFMDYLVRLNGAGREYTGIVGGAFQFVIMISSLVIGKFTDNTRAYYSIAIGMLVLGAFGLAECGVSLDADRGTQLRWSLIVVAMLVGPLQPVSTELGVDVVYPLSENTVLVIQQLFSNLLSALFIPCFKAMRDVGLGELNEAGTEKPQYTFSFYLLIVLHASATVFFATFNGRYLRYEHELEKKAAEERRQVAEEGGAFHYVHSQSTRGRAEGVVPGERMPLLGPPRV